MERDPPAGIRFPLPRWQAELSARSVRKAGYNRLRELVRFPRPFLRGATGPFADIDCGQPGGDLLGGLGRVLSLRLGDQIVLPVDTEPNRGLAPGRDNSDTAPTLVVALDRQKQVTDIGK